jgi:hypothetical protein
VIIGGVNESSETFKMAFDKFEHSAALAWLSFSAVLLCKALVQF